MNKRMLLVALLTLTTSCELRGSYSLDMMGAEQRDVINEVFERSLDGMRATGMSSNPLEDGKGDNIWIGYSNLLSVADKPDLVVPSLLVTRQVAPDGADFEAGSISQEKYLLTKIDLKDEHREMASFTFTRVNMKDQTDTRTLRFSKFKNDWIADVRLAKDKNTRVEVDVFIDKASAAKLGDLFANLQIRLDEMK